MAHPVCVSSGKRAEIVPSPSGMVHYLSDRGRDHSRNPPFPRVTTHIFSHPPPGTYRKCTIPNCDKR